MERTIRNFQIPAGSLTDFITIANNSSAVPNVLLGSTFAWPFMATFHCATQAHMAHSHNVFDYWDATSVDPLESGSPTIQLVADTKRSLLKAFLHGCDLHLRFDFGRMAVRRKLELHPDKDCYYVLTSNLYASKGKMVMGVQGDFVESPMGVISNGTQVNMTTGIVNETADSKVYSDGQLAVYEFSQESALSTSFQ